MLTGPRRLRTAGVLLSAVLVGGCAADPPPAPQSTETSQSAAPAPKAPQIIMAIDSIGPGFNPHLLSDQSPVNAAISALVLPSSFRPVPDPATPTGSRWEMDPALLVSAAVTETNPFTVTYKIRPEAAWTDNAPIAVDCPERRNWKLADGVQCGDSVAIMKGIVPPTCQTPKSPCNSVPSLPSGACVCPRLACPCAASDAAAAAAERAAGINAFYFPPIHHLCPCRLQQGGGD